MESITDEVIMYILIRTDLNMGKGKMIAQASHGAVKCALLSQNGHLEDWDYSMHPVHNYSINRYVRLIDLGDWKRMFLAWDHGLYKKIVLKVEDFIHLLFIFDKIWRTALPIFLVKDAGLTQIPEGTYTSCAFLIRKEDIKKIVPELETLKLL